MTETSVASTAARLDTLTGLRALAAGVVFLKHATAILPTVTADSIAQIIGVCLVVVSFFFLLSGFVLCWVWKPGESASGFYRRRFARLMPNYLLTWVVGGVLTALALQLTGGDAQEAAWSFALGMLLLQSWIPVEGVALGINGVAWTLSCEVFFYALLPFLIGPLTRMTPRLRWWTVSGCTVLVFALPLGLRPDVDALLGMAGEPPSAAALVLYALPLARLPEFVIGCCLALQIKDGWRPRISLQQATTVATFSIIVAGVLRSSLSVTAITLVPFALLIAAAATSDLVGRRSLFSGTWWRRLGDWSFAFYVVHQLVIRVVIALADRAGVTSVPVGVGLAVLSLVLSLALAAAMFTRLERPLERRLRMRRTRTPDGLDVAPTAVRT